MRDTSTPSSYKASSGIAIRHCEYTSGDGVKIAPITNAMTTTYRLYFPSVLGSMMPAIDKMKMTTGVSNTAPNATSNFSVNEKFSSNDGSIWTSTGCWFTKNE